LPSWLPTKKQEQLGCHFLFGRGWDDRILRPAALDSNAERRTPPCPLKVRPSVKTPIAISAIRPAALRWD